MTPSNFLRKANGHFKLLAGCKNTHFEIFALLRERNITEELISHLHRCASL